MFKRKKTPEPDYKARVIEDAEKNGWSIFEKRDYDAGLSVKVILHDSTGKVCHSQWVYNQQTAYAQVAEQIKRHLFNQANKEKRVV